MTRYAMAVDPGGQHTGVVLVELTDAGPVCVDGVTLDRTEEERDTRHMGCPGYVRRTIAACMTMLEKHHVADDDLTVCVETMLPATPVKAGTNVVPMAVWRGGLGAWAVLGGVAAVFPDARLIAPAAADHQAEYPAELKGRTPAGWTAGGSQRQHQRAAWAVLRSGLAQTGTNPATAPAVPVSEPVAIAVPEATPLPMGVAVPRLTPVQQVVELVVAGGVTSVSALLAAATQVWAEGTPSDRVALALAGAMELRPETDRQRMLTRLTARAAKLDTTAAEN